MSQTEEDYHHHPPGAPIAPAVQQFLADHGDNAGLETWQTYMNMVGQPLAFKAWRSLPEATRRAFNEVARATLEDFAVWYDAGHFREHHAE